MDHGHVVTDRIIGAAIEVHRLGPGLLETPYKRALCLELMHQGLTIEANPQDSDDVLRRSNR
jgi:GxxExxY protein